MIWESKYWKKDLLREVNNLKKKQNQSRWAEPSYVLLEKSVMIGFYIIRKLSESKKISDSVLEKKFNLDSKSRKEKPVTFINWHNIDKLYNLHSEYKLNVDVRFICNQFIHSYIFIPTFDEAKYLEGIFFASDKQRKKCLLHISINHIIDIFETAANSYPSKSFYYFNQKKDDYDINLTD